MPLPASTRALFEPRFGHDFSQVQVHTDARAAESARAVNALAYTVGGDIVFGAGQYSPGTAMGQRLLAHELTHVVQQDRGFRAVQRQGKGEGEEKKPPARQQGQPAKAGEKQPSMPVGLHYVSNTMPFIQIADREEYNRCGGDLWSRSAVESVQSEANKIMRRGFGFQLEATYDDLGCIPHAYVVQELSSLKTWITREVVGQKGRRLDQKKTHIFFIDAFYTGGERDRTAGEVVEIGGNLGAIINLQDRAAEGRTMAHELGHTLDLSHPKDYGAAITTEEDFQTCDEGAYLMEWGEGTCVSKWERREARNYGLEKGRLQ